MMIIIFLFFCYFGDQNFGNGSEQWYRQTKPEMPPNVKTAVLKTSPSREKNMEDTFPTCLKHLWVLIFKNIPNFGSYESKGG